MRRLAAVLLALAVATGTPAVAAAQEMPHFPKAHPPQPLPDPPCDSGAANSGDWLLGNWVAPLTRFTFARKGGTIAWTMDRKGGGGEFGWQEGTVIDGTVTAASDCTVSLSAGGDAFVFEGVLTEAGRIYGYATNKSGNDVRFVLRRER